MSLNDLQRHFAQFDWDSLLKEVVRDTDTQIVDLNLSQLEEGKDSLGRLLDDYAEDWYAKMKKQMGSKAPFGTPDLNLEGDFYRGFEARADRGDLIVTSTDKKKDKLGKKYGYDIFGIEKGLKELLIPSIIKIVKS